MHSFSQVGHAHTAASSRLTPVRIRFGGDHNDWHFSNGERVGMAPTQSDADCACSHFILLRLFHT
jgi:hypothetical protein